MPAENARTAIAAAIKRATFAVHKDVESLDAAALKELERIYRAAATDIGSQIERHAGPGGNVALQEMRSVLAQVESRLVDLGRARDSLLAGNLVKAADLGVKPFTPDGAGAEAILNPAAGMQVSHDAVDFVRTFVAADGLQLSDRLWRMDRGTRDAVVNGIEQAVIQGQSAEQAARDLLLRGVGVTDELQAKLKAAQAAGLSRAAQEQLLAEDESGALYQAKRVMRTEINRAHGEAYMKAGEKHPDFAAWRYLLSPAHPAPDICDLLSTQNLHGLGPGCYPDRASTPWPAHPNTLSFIVIKFKNEVTDADRQGKETPMEALKRLPADKQQGVLGMKKWQTLKDGKLTQGMIRAPWRVVQIRAGDRKVVTPLQKPVRPPIAKAQVIPEALNVIRGRLASTVQLRGASVESLRSIGRGLEAVLAPYGLRVGTLGWIEGGRRGWKGVYVHRLFAHEPGVNDELRFNKAYAADSVKQSKNAHDTFLEQRRRQAARLQEMIEDPARMEASKRALQTELAHLRATKRWSVSNDSKDPLFATAAHEATHALYYVRHEIAQAWVSMLDDLKVSRLDRVKVSEYGASKTEELFAEVGALIADERRSEVPEKILQAYDAALAKVK